jgi:hypothetical protein
MILNISLQLFFKRLREYQKEYHGEIDLSYPFFLCLALDLLTHFAMPCQHPFQIKNIFVYSFETLRGSKKLMKN